MAIGNCIYSLIMHRGFESRLFPCTIMFLPSQVKDNSNQSKFIFFFNGIDPQNPLQVFHQGRGDLAKKATFTLTHSNTVFPDAC